MNRGMLFPVLVALLEVHETAEVFRTLPQLLLAVHETAGVSRALLIALGQCVFFFCLLPAPDNSNNIAMLTTSYKPDE